MIQPNADYCSSAASASAADDSAASTAASAGSERDVLIALVRRADAGDPAAQRELVQRYQRRVAGFVRAIIRQPDAVEDVTQTVFIKMFRRLSRLRDPAVFESWLFTLARNTGLDFIRRRSCRPSTVALDDAVNEIADPSAEGATGEILAALDHALARLAPVDRRLVTQFVAGDSYNEIADAAGLSLATVKVRLHRVRPFLRSCVGEMTGTRQAGERRWGSVAGQAAA
jgi:RNA polymerase sigma-70 factor (ECF subfamily)